MKILILNGSPHIHGATSDMVDAFIEGAKEVSRVTYFTKCVNTYFTLFCI